MERGWIKLHRSITDHWIWQDKKYFRWWITVLLSVNHKTVKFPVGDKVYVCNPGESFLSIKQWSILFGCSKRTALKFITLLESDKMVTRTIIGKGNRRKHLLTVSNWTKYQQTGTENCQQKSNRTEYPSILRNGINSKEWEPDFVPISNPTLHPNKKDKKRIKKGRKFLPPSLHEIQTHFQEKINEKRLSLNSLIEAEKFEAHYGANGWMIGKNKMKNWKKAVSGWIARSQNGNYIKENTEPWIKNELK
jgi:hypothetical protein